jgi:hypothetical protein
LLSHPQLVHVAREENGGAEDVVIDQDHLVGDPVEIRERGWYRILLPLGELEQHPVVTLTGKRGELGDRTIPSEAYLNTIRAGLMETYGQLTDADISDYLHAHMATA